MRGDTGSRERGHPQRLLSLGCCAYRIAGCLAAAVSLSRLRLVALVDDPQTLERQQIIDFTDVLGAATHQSCQPSRGDHSAGTALLGDQALENAVDQS